MIKTAITKNGYTRVYLEYDNEKYDIEHVKTKEMIVLRRLSDNQILEMFSDKLGFIIQCDTDQQTNFLVTDYSCVGKGFKHYVDKNASDSLSLKNEFKCNSIYHSRCRITDSSYLVEQSCHGGGAIYNLNKKSKIFSHVYHDDRISEMIGDKTILVSEQIKSSLTYETDEITYGMNPETFEIVTPIWSELQQRYIPVYTKKQIDEINERLRKEGEYFNIENYILDDKTHATISLEVEKELDKLAEYLDKPKSVYLDSSYSEINKDFVKKFVKK